MADTYKKDQKLFRERVGDWQEAYLEKLVKEYQALLQSEKPASEKIRTLESRLRKDQRKASIGQEIIPEIQNPLIAFFLKQKVITEADLEGFSEDMKKGVHLYL